MTATRDEIADGGVWPERPSPRFRRFFAAYVRRLMGKRFHAVRMLAGDGRAFEEADASPRPLIALLSHASWWDPLLALLLWRRYLSRRDILMPMDVAQLRRFGFFRRLGVFGIDPDDPRSLAGMRRHVAARFDRGDPVMLGLTPQGRFSDPREPIRLRPGAAAIAASLPVPPNVLAVSVEYAFWQDARPEVLISATTVEPPTESASTAAWQRAMTDAMGRSRSRLADAAIDRRPEAFDLVLDAGARINPIMDAWLRWRGQSGGIDSRRGREAAG